MMQLAAAVDKIVQQAANAFRGQALQIGVVSGPLVGPIFPLTLTKDASGNRLMN